MYQKMALDKLQAAGPASSAPKSGKTTDTTILSVSNLNAWFGETQALYDISMTVDSNEVVALIGPSGCGKSTFLRCINRLHEEIKDASANGEVVLNGADIYDKQIDPVDIRRKIGMVFQKPNPFPTLSIIDNVTAGLKLSGIRKRSILEEVAEDALRKAALWDEVKDKLKTPATGLSGGQQQRLCIARALAVNPQIILMDEPTSALDPISTASIEELVLDLKKTVTVLIVTHNMQQASRISDKTGFFLLGELIEYKDTSTLFTKPENPKTESYITGRFG